MAETEVDTQGQISVPLGGVDWVLRPSRKSVRKIEAALGLSLHGLAERAIHSQLTLEQAAVIVTECMRAYGEANSEDPLRSSYTGASPEKIEDMIFDAGIAKINPRLVPLLVGALTGGYTPEGELKAA